MVNCRLRWSAIEIVFVSCCHGVAHACVLKDLRPVWLGLLFSTAVVVSHCRYFLERFETFYRLEGWRFAARSPVLFIAEEFARVDYRGRLVEAELPGLIYLSEFLIVLELRALSELADADSMRLVLWPDSLTRSEDCRLRRYLRFELRSSLRGG